MASNRIRNTYWFTAVFILIVVIGVTSYFTLNLVNKNNRSVKHTYEVIEVLQQMEVHFTQAESSARAFMISANPLHSITFEENATQARSLLEKVKVMTADNPVQQKNIASLKSVIENRLTDLSFKIGYRKIKPLDSLLVNGTKTGSELMQKAGDVVNDMRKEELRLLAIRNSRADNSHLFANLIIIGGTILNLLVVLYLIRNIRRTFAKRRSAEQKLSAINKELDELNKQKNYMLGMAAHDLRNPVAAIIMICDLWLPEVEQKLGKDDYAFLKNIQVSGNYMLQLLDDILDVAKIEAGKLSLNLTRVHISPFIERLWKINSMLAERKNIQLKLENSVYEHITIAMDATKIEQVINNLITNAIKFSPAGSEIILRAVIEDSWLKVSVKDKGQGIPAEEQKKLFKAFQRISVQATAGEKSTGLGLMICANIVKDHDGIIDVNSIKGEGSEFYFKLPL